MRGSTRLFGGVLGLSAVLGLGACGGGSSGPSSNTTISQAQAATVGELATSQLGAATSGLASFSVSSGGFTGGLGFARAAGGKPVRLARLGRSLPFAKAVPEVQRSHVAALLATSSCNPTVTGDSTDANGNGIDANAVYTFNSTNCTITTVDTPSSTTTTVGLTGSVHILDNTTGSTLFGYNVQFTNLRYTESVTAGTNPTQTVSFATDGTLGADVLSGAASNAENLTFSFALNGKRAYLMNWDWTVGFVPTTGAVIDTAQASFPSGTFNIHGNFGWNGSFGQANGDWGFTLNSSAPLVYDGSCALDPPFSSGAVDLVITANSSAGATATYSGCGVAPTITAY
jgi:hypothetical protein